MCKGDFFFLEVVKVLQYIFRASSGNGPIRTICKKPIRGQNWIYKVRRFQFHPIECQRNLIFLFTGDVLTPLICWVNVNTKPLITKYFRILVARTGFMNWNHYGVVGCWKISGNQSCVNRVSLKFKLPKSIRGSYCRVWTGLALIGCPSCIRYTVKNRIMHVNFSSVVM